MRIKVTSMGNAGVLLENESGHVYIDAFFYEAPGVGGRPCIRGSEAGKADLILITHPHPDHVDPGETVMAAKASGATIAGPTKALNFFKDKLPPEQLITLEPPEGKKPPASVKALAGRISVTAFRTYHSRGHNSYLIEMGGVRIFHDADNELTQPLDLAALGRIDLLFLCPWAGSGAGEFVAALKPEKWFLIHMTDDEIAAHHSGLFLPGLVSPVPEGVLALRPGEVLEI